MHPKPACGFHGSTCEGSGCACGLEPAVIVVEHRHGRVVQAANRTSYNYQVGRLQRTIETVMGRGRDPLAEVGWDIGAFDGALSYAITRTDLGVGSPAALQPRAELATRFRQHPDAERATRRAVTYQGFLAPIIADWERQLATIRRVLPTGP